MLRGDIYLAAGKGDYSAKPRPVVIVQRSITLAMRDSITVCPMTGEDIASPMFRYPVEPTGDNGLQKRSFVMIDKINTINKNRLGQKVGSLTADDLDAIDSLMGFWLDL